MKKFIAFALLVLAMLQGRSQVNSNDSSLLFGQLAKSKPDTSRVGIFIRLATYYFDKVSLTNYLDSVEFYLTQARQLNEQFSRNEYQNRINILHARHYCIQHPEADVKAVFMPVIDSCKKSGDIFNEQGAWTELADNIGNDPKVASFKINCYQNAMNLAQKRSDKNCEMVLLRGIADVHLQQQKFDLAESELFQILKEEKNINPVYVMYASDLLAAVYMTKGEYDKALLYALKTEKMMQTTGDSTYANTFYNRLAILYDYLGKPAQSVEWEKKYLNHSIWKKDQTKIIRTIIVIAVHLANQQKPQEALTFILEETAKNHPTTINDRRVVQKTIGSCYEALGKYGLAEKCYAEMIRLGNEQKENYPYNEIGDDNNAMGIFYFRLRNYDKARFYLQIALAAYEKYGVLHVLKDLHMSLFKVDSASGNYLNAISHLRQSGRLRDSIFSIARNKQVEELQIAYETEQKDKNLVLLEGKEKLALKDAQQAKNTRNWLMAGAAMLLIIAGLLYRQALIRKRSNNIIKQKNDQLQHLVTEKDWLLKEIHHRVKNNLQIVMSLLNSQSAYIDNEPALAAIHDSQHRVHAMSLIHQKLYNADNLSTIDMSFYIRELVSYLTDSFDTRQRIRFEMDIEPLEMDVSQAVPLGLILNEAITNSIKYAFPDGRSGHIAVSLSKTTADHYLLTVSDNGIGIPNVTNKKAGSLGMSLMAGLSEDLDGHFSIENNNGTTIKISFVHDVRVIQSNTLTPSIVSTN